MRVLRRSLQRANKKRTALAHHPHTFAIEAGVQPAAATVLLKEGVQIVK